MFLLNNGTSNHYMVQTPKKKTIIWSAIIMASWAVTHTFHNCFSSMKALQRIWKQTSARCNSIVQ